MFHLPACATLREYLHPSRIACGLRLDLQVAHDQPLAAALAALLADPVPGAGPADLGGFPAVGRWAGQPAAMVGSEDPAGIPGAPDLDGPTLFDRLDDVPLGLRPAPPAPEAVLHDQAGLLRPILRHALGLRFDFSHREVVTDGPDGAAAVHALTQVDCRPGRPGTGLDADARAAGHCRVIACHDTFEYLDPRVLGDVPTLAGMMDGISARALPWLLAHPDSLARRPRPAWLGAWHGARVALPAGAAAEAIRGTPLWREVAEPVAAELGWLAGTLR